ncbi:hypothetical protein [Olivibacter domesticus]|uniref:Uncharacterized protein n=1 Tax=Olivibacter domesticus TaxID=407022 RepID=A0A1H7IAB1_OLID1|nr:hypothetical protein [Olivibacter domesticus]SEK59429.1 hypothetical protein SAMN05661044_00636 [Olivibacter domesticus]
MKKSNYVYRGLDEIISNEMHPEAVAPMILSNEYIERVKHRVMEEKRRILYEVKDQVFALNTEQESQLLVKKYHNALVVLIGKNHDYQYQTGASLIHRLKEFLASQLQEILHYFQEEFSFFLTGEIWVPITRLAQVREEIAGKLDFVMRKLSGGIHGEAPVYIVREYLDDFISRIDRRVAITAYDLNFTLEMIKDIEEVDMEKGVGMTKCPVLNELLIYWDLNSKATIEYFTTTLDMLVKQYKTESDQLEFLKFEQKRLLQIPAKPGSTYNPSYPSIREYCNQYVTNEITYRENRLVEFAPLPDAKSIEHYDARKFKVTVALSSDQIGLLLRAADELRVLVGRSMRSVFKAIVPFIATLHKDNPSWDNMRTKAYVAEEGDKEVVVEMLEHMIKKVRSY